MFLFSGKRFFFDKNEKDQVWILSPCCKKTVTVTKTTKTKWPETRRPNPNNLTGENYTTFKKQYFLTKKTQTVLILSQFKLKLRIWAFLKVSKRFIIRFSSKWKTSVKYFTFQKQKKNSKETFSGKILRLISAKVCRLRFINDKSSFLLFCSMLINRAVIFFALHESKYSTWMSRNLLYIKQDHKWNSFVLKYHI